MLRQGAGEDALSHFASWFTTRDKLKAEGEEKKKFSSLKRFPVLVFSHIGAPGSARTTEVKKISNSASNTFEHYWDWKTFSSHSFIHTTTILSLRWKIHTPTHLWKWLLLCSICYLCIHLSAYRCNGTFKYRSVGPIQSSVLNGHSCKCLSFPTLIESGYS